MDERDSAVVEAVKKILGPSMVTEDLEEYENAVEAGVTAIYGNRPWFRGVCFTDVRNQFFRGVPILEAVENAADETYFHDGPTFGLSDIDEE